MVMHETAQFLHHQCLPVSGGLQKRGALKENLGTRVGTCESYKYFRANKSYRKAPSCGFVCYVVRLLDGHEGDQKKQPGARACRNLRVHGKVIYRTLFRYVYSC